MKNSTPTRSTSFWFGISAGLLVWVSLASYWTTLQLVHSFNSVAQTHQAMEKFQHIQVLMEAAESGVLGYVLTGETGQLEAYRYAKLVVPYELRQIESLLAWHPEKKRAFNTLRGLVAGHLGYLSKVLGVRKSQGREAATQMIAQAGSRSPSDPMEHVLSEIQQEEQIQLRQRWDHASNHALATKSLWVVSTLVTLILLAWVFRLLRRETSERHQAESTTHRTESFLHSIIERIPYMILVKEAANLRYTLANKAAEEWLGKSRETLLASNDLDLRPKAEALEAIQRDRDILKEGRLSDHEESLILPGQEERVIRTQKIPVPDSEGNPAYLLSISEDITQRKQAERMLQHSRDAAVEAARLRSEFIRNMSHEFRTPLSIVMGMTSLILDTELSTEQMRFASTVKRAADGLANLIKSILDFSKIESGTFTLETREVHVREIVDDVVGMLREQAKAKQISLVSLCSNDLPTIVRGDPVRLRQVLTQLMANALKFTERGEVTLRVSEEKQTDSQLWLTCRITDTGIGISEADQKHLFEAFRQADGSRTRRYGGTGLGLAVSKRIVELMGGTIGFESTVGQGSSFWFTIPFNKRHVHGPVVQVASLPWMRSRVMIVSENETYRQLLSQHLAGWALASEAVSSGQTALELLQREQKAARPFPIVLLDMHLSDMDSVDFAKAVKHQASLAGTKLVVMTGEETAMDAATAVSLGFSGCLRMPLEPEELYQRLASLIDPRKPLNQEHAA